MTFEFDPAKARKNLRKHGISFELAMRVWADPLHRIAFDRTVAGEDRWHAIGDVDGRLLVAGHTYPDGNGQHVRLLSARKLQRHERRRYEESGL